MSETATDYKATVFLPRTEFPMRGELPKREPELLARWEQMGLWQKLRAAAKGRPSFILHDGPPYANGNLHIGHALNKIHKDVINRAQQMAGRDANYIPGWDCHGLPIEWKIEEQYRKAGRDKDQVPVLEFRRECREYAQHWLDVQAEEFKRLGVAGDWANRYATMDFASEAAIAGEIGKFLLNGALYRGLRPVMWSPVEKTALAEAEVEYYDKKDTAIYVRFRISNPVYSGQGYPLDRPWGNASFVIWTTTPWTIPGNQALAVNAGALYSLILVTLTKDDSLALQGEEVVIAKDLINDFCSKVGILEYVNLGSVKGKEFEGWNCKHPFYESGFPLKGQFGADGKYGRYPSVNPQEVKVLCGDFVTTDVGTGVVHMAPGHGEDDFNLCKMHNIGVPDTVQGDGTYYPSVPLFSGLHVYKAAGPVCDALMASGALLHREEFMHSYPHSWRSKAPLIYRATPNWFIRMDGPEHIRDNALTAIDATRFVPEIGRNRIRAMVESRPDWCISRQRAWGVPIAIFVDKTTHEPLRDAAVMARVVEIFEREGADAWYARPARDFLGDGYDAADYEQVFDIVDVWFESGSTHAFVLEARGLPVPADVYLEGSDQHRGWFQASLLESVGTRGVAPFKAIVTDGFVLDEAGRKMSKSLGNVTAPQEVNDKYGADILRLWVMNSDTSEDLRIGPEILKQQAELYRRLRNTLRWLLGSLDGFTDAEKLPEAEFPELERLILHRLWELNALIMGAVESHDWTGVYPTLHNFCASDLSAFYFDIRKDSLYCDRPDSQKRRACRTVLDVLHRTLTAWLAPALPFTAEDSWTSRYGSSKSIHTTLFPTVPSAWRDNDLAVKWAKLREFRADVTGEIERFRRDKKIGSSLQSHVILHPDRLDGLKMNQQDWADLLIVSKVQIDMQNSGAGRWRDGISFTVEVIQYDKCERCWRLLKEVGEQELPTLCRRCVEAVT